MGTIQFSQIHPRAFSHPSDQRATAAFQQIPLFPELLRKISELGIEERFRAHHMRHSVELGPRQFSSLWRMVHDVAEHLGIPAPRTYLSRQNEANAFAFGKETHSIVLTTELVDLMTDEELRGIIAHEMGHILCEHMLYMDVGLALTSGATSSLAKVIPALRESVAGLFFAWFRAAEYSADRAAMLILEDPELLARSLSRLAGVPQRFEGEFDLRRFAEQAKNYEEEATLWSKIATLGMGLFLTHPEPAKRVGAILQWADSEEYRAILRGHYLTRFEAEALDRIQIPGVASCPLCRNPVGQASVCGICELPQDPRRQQPCPERGHINSIDWKFCKACGAALRPGLTRSEIPGC